jgi:sugar lactone lactonase YvrE
LDSSANIYVAGWTNSADFDTAPLVTPIQVANAGSFDGFVTKISAPLPVVTSLPVITNVDPSGGISAGGTTVVITGSGFTGTTGVKFAGVNATSYLVDSNTQITAISPAHASGIVHIVATNLVGSSTIVPEDNYIYFVTGSTTPAPIITSVNPSGGIPAGGTTVVITGSGFTGITSATGVKFDGVNATSYVVDSNTQITAISPAHASGIVNIVATSLVGASPIVPADTYTYFIAVSTTPAPIITSVNPSGGIPAGGTTVVITGSGFTGITGANGVKFGAENATSYVVDSNTQITAVSPAHVSGTVDIVATSPVGSSAIVSDDNYTYFIANPITLAPIITRISPALGPTTGDTTVIITGSGFTGITGANGVKFGELNAASYIVNSDTQITAKTKVHAVGIVDVVATSMTGASAIVFADHYTYFLTPIVPVGSYFNPYIFPSPTTGNNAGIVYNMVVSGLVNIRVYNEIGELVYTLDESKPAGTQGSSINVSKLAPGVYFCLLKVNYDDGNTKKYSKLKFAVIH